MGAIVTLAAFGIIIAWGFRKTQAPVREVFPFNPVQPGLLLPIALCVLGLIIVSSNVDQFVGIMFPPPKWFTSSFFDILRARYGFALISFAVLVVSPVSEEVFFRGLVLHGFLRRYGEAKAVLASAILFGAFHMNPWQFSSAVVGGLFLGWLFVETRSLVPCIIGHAINNIFPLVLSFLVIRNPHGRTVAALGSHPIEPPWLVFTGATVLAVGAYLFVRTVRMKPVTSTHLAQTNAGGICHYE
jgi:membrane protease YdiL (CAAX protease family)